MSTEDNSGTRIITHEQAVELLYGVHHYFASEDDHLLGKHRVEVLADAMLREGYADLSRSAIAIHNALKGFHRGNYVDVAVLLDSDLVESFLKKANGTRYDQAARDIMEPIYKLTEQFADVGIDWRRSASVIAQVKQECYPGDLSMTEKLTIWEQEQSRGPTP